VLKHPKGDFLIQDRYLFKGAWLCFPKCRTRELLVREVHGGSLAGHYGENKISIVLKEHYYWPSIDKDVQDILRRCAMPNGQKPFSSLRPLQPFGGSHLPLD